MLVVAVTATGGPMAARRPCTAVGRPRSPARAPRRLARMARRAARHLEGERRRAPAFAFASAVGGAACFSAAPLWLRVVQTHERWGNGAIVGADRQRACACPVQLNPIARVAGCAHHLYSRALRRQAGSRHRSRRRSTTSLRALPHLHGDLPLGDTQRPPVAAGHTSWRGARPPGVHGGTSGFEKRAQADERSPSTQRCLMTTASPSRATDEPTASALHRNLRRAMHGERRGRRARTRAHAGWRSRAGRCDRA